MLVLESTNVALKSRSVLADLQDLVHNARNCLKKLWRSIQHLVLDLWNIVFLTVGVAVWMLGVSSCLLVSAAMWIYDLAHKRLWTRKK